MTKRHRGVGLDCGTMNFVAARIDELGTALDISKIRNVFVSLPKDKKRMLKMMGKADFIEREEDLILIGEKAFELANTLKLDMRRPLQGGLISSSETDANMVLATMIKNILGEPRIENEACYYSVPAKSVDDPSRDVVYHEKILGEIITKCGYRAIPSNEAMAIIFSECQKEDYSGICISMGSGMSNIALGFNTFQAHTFSVAMGGDFIDAQAAKSIGPNTPPSRLCAIKEKGLDLMSPSGKEQEALKIYYKYLIETVLHQFVMEFDSIKDEFFFDNPIPIVIGGGTSQAKGFIQMFTEIFETKRNKFPIKISEIRAAKNPLNAVAQGLFIQATQEYED